MLGIGEFEVYLRICLGVIGEALGVAAVVVVDDFLLGIVDHGQCLMLFDDVGFFLALYRGSKATVGNHL